MRIVLALILIVCSLNSCRKKDPPKDAEPGKVFDKKALLVNMADRVIKPDYQNFKAAFDSLVVAFSRFTVSGSVGDFTAVRSEFIDAYRLYQRISPYEFGPAETVVIQMNFNVFPADTVKIKNNISNGGYNLSSVANFAAKGFPALDYLFFGNGVTASGMAEMFVADNNRQKYVKDLFNDMILKIEKVNNDWKESYRETFINSLSTDIGSSIGFLVNRINFELDYLKNAKIGIPAGKKSLGEPIPGNCEALYCGESLQYAVETLNAIENLYLGRSAEGVDGSGFDDYLAHLESKHPNGPLHVVIKSQFTAARKALSSIPGPLSKQVIEDVKPVDLAHTELLKLLVLLKTDMPSALGVVITYQDGDGD